MVNSYAVHSHVHDIVCVRVCVCVMAGGGEGSTESGDNVVYYSSGSVAGGVILMLCIICCICVGCFGSGSSQDRNRID